MSKGIISDVFAVSTASDYGTAALRIDICTEKNKKSGVMVGVSPCASPFEKGYVYDNGEMFHGRGQKKTSDYINRIVAPELIGKSVLDYKELDELIDSFPKEMLGVNARYALSMSIIKTAAAILNQPLYLLLGKKMNKSIPIACSVAASGSMRYGGPAGIGYKPTYSFVAWNFDSFKEASYALWMVDTDWKETVRKELGIKLVADSGMCVLPGKVESDDILWEMMNESIKKSGYKGFVGLQGDIAAGRFFKGNGKYEGLFEKGVLSAAEVRDTVQKMVEQYGFLIIEDPFVFEDFDKIKNLDNSGKRYLSIDDAFCGDIERIASCGANTVTLKPSQIGTVTEITNVIVKAREKGFMIMPSGSRGEGIDICDIAVGFDTQLVREPALSYHGNRYLQIESELGECFFCGKKLF